MPAPRGIGALGVLAVLAACSAPPGGQGASGQGAAGQAAAQPIECALSGAAAFTRDCALERSEREAVRYAVVRRPDGGFRRFVEQADGSLATADGVDAVQATLAGGMIDLAVGADRYRIPVARHSQAPANPVASHVP